MGKGVMQCKDIPDRPILEFLQKAEYKPEYPFGTWCVGYKNSVGQAMPPGVPEKLIQAKMRTLMDRGLVDGCGCGCRGDYEITRAGSAYLMQTAPSGASPRPPEGRNNTLDPSWTPKEPKRPLMPKPGAFGPSKTLPLPEDPNGSPDKP